MLSSVVIECAESTLGDGVYVNNVSTTLFMRLHSDVSPCSERE